MSNYTIALAGLQNTSRALDTVSNNIANANTIGYKAGEYLFADQFIKAVNPADAARVGMGSQTQGVRRAMTQGTINNSQNPLDMAISGDGMFILSDKREAPSGDFYTRNGQFRLDSSGYIVNENGMYLMGFEIEDKELGGPLEAISNDPNLRLSLPPDQWGQETTTDSAIGVILDSRGQAFTSTANVAFDPDQNTYNSKTTQTVYDVEGNTHTLEVYYRRIAAGAKTIAYDSTANGWTYSPSLSSVPNTLGDTKVTINNGAIVRVDTAAIHADALVSVATASGASTLTMTANVPATVMSGAKVYKNGIDTGLTTSAAGTGQAKTIALSGTLAVNAGDAISFYPPSTTLAVSSASSGSTLTFATNVPSSVVNAAKVYKNGVDTGLTTTAAGSTTTIGLSGNLSVAAGDLITFGSLVNMTMIAPDGTEIPVSGSSNLAVSGNKLCAVTDQVEVYASFDGRFANKSGSGVEGNRTIPPQTIGLGYNPFAKMEFLGGRNIDALMEDPQSGNPVFKTETHLSTTVTAADGEVQAIEIDLDLTHTKLSASEFQVVSSVQDGQPSSDLTNVTIDSSGRIIGVYGNGKQVFWQQVALIHFDNYEGLVPVGNNAYAASVESGTIGSSEGVQVGYAGQGPFGEIKSMALEASNVDLANELVKLMVLQRSYTANSQSMRATDQMIRDTLQMGN